MQNQKKTKQFLSELRNLKNKHEIRIFVEDNQLFFENEDMDIKVKIDEELNDEILEI